MTHTISVEEYLSLDKEFLGSGDYNPYERVSFWDDTVSSMTLTGTTTSNKTDTIGN